MAVNDDDLHPEGAKVRHCRILMHLGWSMIFRIFQHKHNCCCIPACLVTLRTLEDHSIDYTKMEEARWCFYILLALMNFSAKLAEATFGKDEQLRSSNFQHSILKDFQGLDCSIRRLAFNFSVKILPGTANFNSIFDALELATLCGDTFHLESNKKRTFNGHLGNLNDFRKNRNSVLHYIVDPRHGKDSYSGVISAPFRSVEAALQKCKVDRGDSVTLTSCVIHLREGTYFLEKPIQLGPDDSNILVTRYLDEEAVVSGGKTIKTDWKQYYNGMKMLSGENAIFEDIKPGESTSRVSYLGKYEDLELCKKACTSNTTCTAFSYFDTTTGDFSQMCYGRLDGWWNTVQKTGVTSGNKVRTLTRSNSSC